jgi:hypothetical protein
MGRFRLCSEFLRLWRGVLGNFHDLLSSRDLSFAIVLGFIGWPQVVCLIQGSNYQVWSDL